MTLSDIISILTNRAESCLCDGTCDEDPPHDKCKECRSRKILNDVNEILKSELCSQYELLQLDGLNTRRLKTNPNEKIYLDEWKKLQIGHTFAHIMNPGNELDYSKFSERDVIVAATIIQWLGSPLGTCFLKIVQEKINDLN